MNWSNVFSGARRQPQFARILKGNPYHDASGKFTSADGEGMQQVEGKWHGADGKPVDDAKAARMKELGVPPKWTRVRLNDDPKADLQAMGVDSKGRTQYLYSAEHSERAAAEKFERLGEFNKVAGRVSKDSIADMNNTKLPQETRDAAAVTALISKTGFRIGGENDTGADKQAYGASTLEGRHVKVNGDTIEFQFTGKKGVEQRHTLEDADLAKYIKERKAEAGSGKLFRTSDAKVRDYFKSKAGDDFKVKDYRTWHGTSTALREVSKMPVPKTEKEYKAARLAVGKVVAKKLGNTPTVALASYINPTVFHKWGFHGK